MDAYTIDNIRTHSSSACLFVRNWLILSPLHPDPHRYLPGIHVAVEGTKKEVRLDAERTLYAVVYWSVNYGRSGTVAVDAQLEERNDTSAKWTV